MSREYIASVLKRLRAEQGMTADEVGEIIGKSGKTVSGWENARSQPDADLLLNMLADEMITLCALLDLEINPQLFYCQKTA